MATHTFLVPKEHVLEKILAFGRELAEYEGGPEAVRFDFQGKGLDTPFGMLYLAFAIQKFIQEHPNTACRPVHYEERDYAAYMGYFQACGFKVGNQPGQAPGSDTYLPVTILPAAQFREQARDEARAVGDVVEEYSQKLSTILLQKDTGPLAEMLSYSFREMIRNVIEHSQSPTLGLCAQYRKKAKQAEIAIIDTGLGIRSTLANNPYLNIQSDRDALNLSIMPGISGKAFQGTKRDPYDVWQNSGYGLFAVSRLCGHGGKFTLCSGDTALALKPDAREYHPAHHQGTALRIILSASGLPRLSDIMKEGDRQARELGLTDALPSAASKMLSSEFNKK